MRLGRMGALVLGAAAALTVVAAGGAAGAGERTTAASVRAITVTGSGAARAMPNRVSFFFGVATQAKSASAAMTANNSEMSRVIAAVKGAGVASRDIQTSSVSLSPRYSRTGEEIVGYRASNSVSAMIRSVSDAGKVIDAAVGAGANQVDGPSFTRSGEAALYRRALRAAVADARAKAQTLAAAGRVRLGAVRSIVEASAAPLPLAEKAAGAGTSIEPGTQTILASVTVEFGLR